ncbi:hypothetical protein O3P69_013620 [Scylla paramamosain]|uniref:Uncharacterized protein n=1 Tax=Scylla paramamosain TaxID=85552 RepID=A0AAW0SPR6_SCYPA
MPLLPVVLKGRYAFTSTGSAVSGYMPLKHGTVAAIRIRQHDTTNNTATANHSTPTRGPNQLASQNSSWRRLSLDHAGTVTWKPAGSLLDSIPP